MLLLDVDGTATESHSKIDDELLSLLQEIHKKMHVCFVSGGPYERIKSQVIMPALFLSQGGNRAMDDERKITLWEHVIENEKEILAHIHTIAEVAGVSVTPEKVEHRGRQISFSFVGHKSPLEEKKKFDPDRSKRTELLRRFPFKNAAVGGTTCIDYTPRTKGENVQTLIELLHIAPEEALYLGDSFGEHGNDTTVVGVVPTQEVRDPAHTLEFLSDRFKRY